MLLSFKGPQVQINNLGHVQYLIPYYKELNAPNVHFQGCRDLLLEYFPYWEFCVRYMHVCICVYLCVYLGSFDRNVQDYSYIVPSSSILLEFNRPYW